MVVLVVGLNNVLDNPLFECQKGKPLLDFAPSLFPKGCPQRWVWFPLVSFDCQYPKGGETNCWRPPASAKGNSSCLVRFSASAKSAERSDATTCLGVARRWEVQRRQLSLRFSCLFHSSGKRRVAKLVWGRRNSSSCLVHFRHRRKRRINF